MEKKTVFLACLILCVGSITHAGKKQTQQLSNTVVQRLETKGFKVHGLHKSVRSPVRGEQQKSDTSEIVEIEASVDLRKSGINPVYRGARLHVKTSDQASSDSILVEDFEGEFPGSVWQLSGNPTWGKASVQRRTGASSVWCAAGGDSAKTPGGAYPNNLQAMMVYGPFDLSNVNYGELKFFHWLDTEWGKDWFFYMLSTDGVKFSGVGLSGQTGNSGGVWTEEKLPLSNVPELGDVTGSGQVWLAFLFDSDDHSTPDKGVYIDNITLTKRKISGTPIAGAIFGALFPENNPYIAPMVAGVAEGDSLEIRPGVEIRFEKGAEFVVLGYLNGVGTPSDSIVFTLNSQVPQPGDWGGITFFIGSQKNLEYAKIEYAEYGIYSLGASSRIRNCMISKNSLEGIYVRTDNRYVISSPLIDGNVIRENGNRGIYSWLTNAVIVGNTIEKNKGTGVEGSTSNLAISGNVIRFNGSDGVHGGGVYLGLGSTYHLIDNEISHNGKNGIAFSGYASGAYITKNFILENGINGIDLSQISGFELTPPQATMKIFNNTLVGNRSGIYFGKTVPRRSSMSWAFRDSHVLNNIIANQREFGIYFETSTARTIAYNNFYNNAVNFPSGVSDFLGVIDRINARGDSTDFNHNVFLDPNFVAPHEDDYGLGPNSPCKDAGHPSPFYNDSDGTGNDMGAFGGTGIFVLFQDANFGEFVIGQERGREISLTNSRIDSIKISNFELSDNENFKFSETPPLFIKPFDYKIISVIFTPKTTGNLSTTLSLFSDDFSGTGAIAIDYQGKAIYGTLVNGGNISGVWAQKNSPYVIRGGVSVPKNDSLIIEPGVDIRFDVRQVSSWPDKLAVYGTLLAIGTEKDSITFQSSAPELVWYGLDFEASSSGSALKYCLIKDVGNTSYAAVDNQGSSITIENCYFRNNSGGIRTFGGIVQNNVFKNNRSTTSNHAGVLWVKGNASIIGNTIIDNRGIAGMYISGGAPIVVGNTISSNTARNLASDPDGGVFIIDAKEMLFINNVVFNNETASNTRSSGIYAFRSTIVAKNNIIYANRSPNNKQIIATQGSVLTLEYSNIQGGWEGEGNINADPLFVDAERGDFRLQDNSPCIDSGDPAPEYNDPEDPNNPGLALAPALRTLRNDMGAYGGPWAASTYVNYPPAPFHLLSPARIDTVTTDTLRFVWQRSNDPNPIDAVRYTLQLDTTKTFSRAMTFGSITDTSYALANKLMNNTRYYWTVSAFDIAGLTTASPDTFSFVVQRITTAVQFGANVPTVYALSQNYPNPFNPETTIHYQLPQASEVRLEIFNLLGQRVATLVEKKQPAGHYAVVWDGKDAHGGNVASGVFLYRLQAGDFVAMRKLTVLR